MATSIDEICGYLQQDGLRFERVGDDQVRFGITTERYTNPRGQKGLFLIISLSENGEYFTLFAPQAFQVTGPHVDAFLRACMLFQWKTKLIQFEYDDSDGEIRPVIEFPIEDSRLTHTQLRRCLHGIVTLVDDAYPVFKRALDTGVVEFPGAAPGLPGVIEEMLRRQIEDLRRTGAPAEQIAALETLLASVTGGRGSGPAAL